jgi:vomeronasal1 receptor
LLAGQKMRPKDLIVNHLVLANNVVVLSKGIPQTMATFGWNCFLDDAACKVVLYLQRVARGVSLKTTCLLSGFQATKLCSENSWCNKFTNSSPQCFGFSGFYFWILQLVVNVYIPMRVTGPRCSQNTSVSMCYRYCSSGIPNILLTLLHLVLFSSIDVICLGFMVWSSGSMVLVLHRHKQQVQHIHSHRLSSRSGHESRAICTILILVSMFVLFYYLSSTVYVCLVLIENQSQWLWDTSMFLDACFPALSRFVFIISDTHLSQIFHSCTRQK